MTRVWLFLFWLLFGFASERNSFKIFLLYLSKTDRQVLLLKKSPVEQNGTDLHLQSHSLWSQYLLKLFWHSFAAEMFGQRHRHSLSEYIWFGKQSFDFWMQSQIHLSCFSIRNTLNPSNLSRFSDEEYLTRITSTLKLVFSFTTKQIKTNIFLQLCLRKMCL